MRLAEDDQAGLGEPEPDLDSQRQGPDASGQRLEV